MANNSKSDSKSLPSRRDFIRTGAAAAALAAPYYVPSTAFGKTAPSNRINVGFIGTGNQGFLDIKLFMKQPDCQVVALCDVNKGSTGYKKPEDVRGLQPALKLVKDYYAKATNVENYNGCDTYSDFRDLIARDDIDAVVVVAPDHWHEIMTIKAAEAGKDIYCEKPLGLTIAGQQRMIKAVRDNNRVVQTGSHERSNPYIRAACELVQSGALGKIEKVECNIGRQNKISPPPGWQPMAVPEGFDYDMWLGPAPDAPYHKDRCLYNFRFISDYSGGQTTNFGAHSIDIAQWGLGKDGTGPVEVEHRYVDYLPEGSLFDAATYVGFRCKYPGGLSMEVRTAAAAVRTAFYGTDGFVSIDSQGQNATVIPRGIAPELLQERVKYHSGADHVRNFLDCVKSREEPNAPIEIGHRSASICHIGNIAMSLKAKLRWDPKKEQFRGSGSEEANAMLDRESRTTWSS